MLNEFLSIIIKSIRLDKSLYSNNKNFGEASIYFAVSIILIGSIISIIPNSSFLNYMSLNFNLGQVMEIEISIPIWWMFLAFPVGFLILALTSLELIFDNIINLIRN